MPVGLPMMQFHALVSTSLEKTLMLRLTIKGKDM